MSNELIKAGLTSLAPQLKSALPPHISVEKFTRVAQTAILTNPGLANLERNSLFAACIEAAQDGLLPDGKEAAIVPFKGAGSYMPMVGGILKKIRNSGELGSITAQMIHKNDEFEYWTDEEGEHLKHRPNMLEDRGVAIGVYAMARTKDNSVYIEIMNKEQVMAIKGVSRSKGGPWSGPFEHEMWKKSAIRRLSKRLPMSTDQETLIQKDDKFYDFEQKNIRDVAPEDHTAPHLEVAMGIAKESPVLVTDQPEEKPQQAEVYQEENKPL